MARVSLLRVDFIIYYVASYSFLYHAASPTLKYTSYVFARSYIAISLVRPTLKTGFTKFTLLDVESCDFSLLIELFRMCDKIIGSRP